jgi:50S ribosomal protein L16 3-hydroxylase
VGRDRLFELAAGDDVESRLVTRTGRQWKVSRGPLARMPPLRRPAWTLLVQGVDLHDDGAHELLARFRFVPDARLDDLMVSYATDGGGVGPHIDSYDVFLLQAHGRRRWRISHQRDLTTVPGAPIAVLANFRAEQEWILEAGDLLYVPPGVAHDGVALGESLTYSIGFRAASYQELLEPWLADFAATARVPGRYADRGLAPVRRPAELPSAMIDRVHAELRRHRPRRADTQRFLLRHLTEPKAQVVFDRPHRPLGSAAWFQRAARRGVTLDRRTRMLTTRDALAINGEWIAPAHRSLAALANERRLPAAAVAALPLAGQRLVHAWYTAGWLHLDEEEPAR